MRLIDADALKNDNWNVFEDEHGLPVAYVLVEDVRHAPTVDAVEVVRCKDCKWWEDWRCTNKNGAGCTVFNGDWFCCAGERKEK